MKQIVQLWLSTQFNLVCGAQKAIILLGTPGKGPYRLSASLPDQANTAPSLLAIANKALSQKECVTICRKNFLEPTGEPLDEIACPLFFDDQLHGIIAFELTSRPEMQQLEVIKSLQAGALWLEMMLQQQAASSYKQLVAVTELIAACIEHQSFQQSVMEVVTDLAARFSCEYVCAGFLYGDQHLHIIAISNSAQINHRSPLVRNIADVLQEAVDQREVIHYPLPEKNKLQIARIHKQFSAEHGGCSLSTIPFMVNGVVAGAFLFEAHSGKHFDQKTIESCRLIISLIGPVLELRRKEDRLFIQKAGDSFRQTCMHITGPGNLISKLTLITAVMATLFFSLVTADYRVVADATLEPVMQRAIVASQKGFIEESRVRAGDEVKAGDILATLDTKDLVLEKQKYLSQREQQRKEYAEALARHNRSRVNIIKAKLTQAEARINLVREQLARTQMTAPFDGLVVRGDLSQALGSPVERGEVLFEVAPMDSYHVILQVDERDIGMINGNLQGQLILSGMPGEVLDFTVKKITPVSVTADGRNYFRVEAELKPTTSVLRPGMTGVAKIIVGRRKLVWIWTHQMIDWLRIHTWTFIP